MIHTITTEQKIYKIYQLLHKNNTEHATELASSTLFDALNLYVGQFETSVGESPNAGTAVLDKVSDVKLLVFYYLKADLFEEVYKRTSYLGKAKKDQDGNHMLEAIALTKDDMPLFESFLRSACANVFTVLEVFSRQVNSAFLYLFPSGIEEVEEDNFGSRQYEKGERMLYKDKIYEAKQTSGGAFDENDWIELDPYIYTDDKVEFILMPPKDFNYNVAQVVDTFIFESITNYILYKWCAIVNPEQSAYYLAEHERYNRDITKKMSSTSGVAKRRYRWL